MQIGYSKTQQIGKSSKKKKQREKNIDINKALDKIYKKKKLFKICEARYSKNCLKHAKVSRVGTKLDMTYAHKHKRKWYKVKGANREHLAATYEETFRACLTCHFEFEHKPKVTEDLFKKLRPEG